MFLQNYAIRHLYVPAQEFECGLYEVGDSRDAC